jgi:hypothetical protein
MADFSGQDYLWILMKTSSPRQSSVAPSSTAIPPRPEEEIADEVRDIREAVGHEEVARRAHQLWEQEGCPDGKDSEHWLEAERQLRRGTASSPDARDQARAIKDSAERRARSGSKN